MEKPIKKVKILKNRYVVIKSDCGRYVELVSPCRQALIADYYK